MMGIRADMTPQVARIDAHRLRRPGPTRLCYVGTVLHTLPESISGGRSPIQIGAELYGHDGFESDCEIVCLMLESLAEAAIGSVHLDMGHVGVFRALARRAALSPERRDRIAHGAATQGDGGGPGPAGRLGRRSAVRRAAHRACRSRRGPHRSQTRRAVARGHRGGRGTRGWRTSPSWCPRCVHAIPPSTCMSTWRNFEATAITPGSSSPHSCPDTDRKWPGEAGMTRSAAYSGARGRPPDSART